jgi:hypothetical protein
MNGLNAIRKRITEIVVIDERPFSFLDFREFQLEGVSYRFAHGTIRNILSKLRMSKEIELAYNSGIAFYTLPGKIFNRQETGASILHQPPIKGTPIYKWLKNRRIDKQALHNIRLTFEVNGIWTLFYKKYPNLMDSHNQDINLPPLIFLGYLNIGTTVHHSDVVSVSIGCSFRPIALDVPDILHLIEVLTRVEMNLTSEIDKLFAYDLNSQRVSVPRFTRWIIKMLHFGVDTLDEYDKEEFHVTFEEGISDLFRIYTKRMKDNRVVVRVERQEYPNEDFMFALVKKLYPDGRLVNS